jgi:hypothetical protein
MLIREVFNNSFLYFFYQRSKNLKKLVAALVKSENKIDHTNTQGKRIKIITLKNSM